MEESPTSGPLPDRSSIRSNDKSIWERDCWSVSRAALMSSRIGAATSRATTDVGGACGNSTTRESSESRYGFFEEDLPYPATQSLRRARMASRSSGEVWKRGLV